MNYLACQSLFLNKKYLWNWFKMFSKMLYSYGDFRIKVNNYQIFGLALGEGLFVSWKKSLEWDQKPQNSSPEKKYTSSKHKANSVISI